MAVMVVVYNDGRIRQHYKSNDDDIAILVVRNFEVVLYCTVISMQL